MFAVDWKDTILRKAPHVETPDWSLVVPFGPLGSGALKFWRLKTKPTLSFHIHLMPLAINRWIFVSRYHFCALSEIFTGQWHRFSRKMMLIRYHLIFTCSHPCLRQLFKWLPMQLVRWRTHFKSSSFRGDNEVSPKIYYYCQSVGEKSSPSLLGA